MTLLRSALLATAVPLLLGATPLREVAAVDGANLQRPSWSPDGRHLSWEANYHKRKAIELYVGDPNRQTFVRVRGARRSHNAITAGFVTSDTASRVVHELCWGMGEEGRYVFSASSGTQDYDLFLEGGGAIAPAEGADGGPQWSPDGSKLIFTSARTGGGDLYLLDADAMEAEPVRLTDREGSAEVYARWSPNGREVIYVSHSDTGDNLWLQPLDGEATQLTNWAGNQVRPRLDPTGEHVAFYANHTASDRWDLYVVHKAGDSEPVLLLEGVKPDLAGPAWDPSGGYLVAVKEDAEAGDPLVVVASKATEDGPDVRPIPLGTINHGDLDLTQRDGILWIAFVAQGRETDVIRTFKRLYVSPITPFPPQLADIP